MPSDRLEGVALVTGGGRGIGASIARELAGAGMRVAVTGRTRGAGRSGRRARSAGSRSSATSRRADDVERWVEATERELGPIDLLVATRASAAATERSWEMPVRTGGTSSRSTSSASHLCCRAVVPRMLERGRRRIVITGSGGAYLPGPSRRTAYPTSKAARRAATARRSPTRSAGRHPGLPLQPGPRPHGHDRALRRRRSRGRHPSSHRGSCACSPRAAQTRSPAATSTPSTTTSRTHPPSRRDRRRRPERDPAHAAERNAA